MPIDPRTGVFTPLYDWEREAAAREKLTLPRLKQQEQDMADAINGLLNNGVDDGPRGCRCGCTCAPLPPYELPPAPPVEVCTYPQNVDDGTY